MGADYSFYVKSIATYASTFFRYNNSVLAILSEDDMFEVDLSDNFTKVDSNPNSIISFD